LGAEDHEVLRIFKNIYGNATAARALWEDINKTPKSMGGIRLLEILLSGFGSERTPIHAMRLTPLRQLASWEAMWMISTVLATWAVLNGWKSERSLTKHTLGEL